LIWLRLLLPLALGALSALGFAPWGVWTLTLLCIAGWLFLIHEARSIRAVLATGWLFGLGHFSVANLWIADPFQFQDAMPHWLGYIAVVLVASYLAIYPMLAAGVTWRLASPMARGDPAPSPSGSFVLIAGAAWIATEYLRGTMFTGYPWDPLATIWVPTHLSPIARATGTYALSGLTVVVAGTLLLLVHRQWKLALGASLVAIALLAATLHIPAGRTPAAPPLRVRIVQPNLPEEERPTDAYAESNFQALAKLSGRPGRTPRLILWPEGAIRFPVEDGYPRYVYMELGSALMARARMAALLGDHDMILTGAQAMYFNRAEDMTAAANSIVAVGPDARLHGRYDKAHLVPYGEYLPARPVLEAIGLSRLVPGDIDFLPGPGPRTIALPGFGKVGMLICYEVIFSGQVVDPRHRPAFIFNPSNDAWFGDYGPPAHLAQARLRAIEEGLPILRSTPTGISAVIDADGRVVASVPMHRAGAAEAFVPRALPPTLFARLGNWMAGITAALLLILAIAIRRRAR
jgi:apolipoprotein N-acyltransferase